MLRTARFFLHLSPCASVRSQSKIWLPAHVFIILRPPAAGKAANAKNTPLTAGCFLLSGDQIFVTILMPGPMVDAVTQDLMYWPFAAAGLALMIAPMSAL